MLTFDVSNYQRILGTGHCRGLVIFGTLFTNILAIATKFNDIQENAFSCHKQGIRTVLSRFLPNFKKE
jgi:hypothetical protein